MSSYLAAQWLLRLRGTNLSSRQLHGLLFAQSYGIDLIRPSMQETAAWLSIEDIEIAREVIRREPAVLLSAGDPASLPTSIRMQALLALSERMCVGEDVPTLDTRSLTRFAQPDIAATLRQLWEAHSGHIQVRTLVLKLVWLGAVRECADIAASAAYGAFDDKSTLYLAGEALIAAGDPGQRRAYGEHIKLHSDTVPSDLLAAAVEALFPEFVTVDDIIAMFASGALNDEGSTGYNLKWSWAKLLGRISSPGELEKLISGLLDLNASKAPRSDLLPGEKEESLDFLLAAAGERLLALSGPDTAPDAAIDAVLFFCEPLGTPHGSGHDKLRGAILRLHESAARRRAAFWRAAQTLAPRLIKNGKSLQDLHDMTFAGWDPGLQPGDLAWLLEDGPARAMPSEQRLAASAAMVLWAKQGQPSDVLARIKDAASPCDEMRAVVDDWLKPPSRSPELDESTRRFEEVRAEHDQRQAELENGWVDFVTALRDDPHPMSKLRPATSGTVNQALIDLWQLLREVNRGKNRYAIDNVAPLAELVGDKVVHAFTEAMRQMWRERRPVLPVERAPNMRNMNQPLDLMGLAAVSLEAAMDPTWPNRLSAGEAARAAEYATLEINAFPPWIDSLARAWTTAVRDALMTEVLGEMDTPGDETHRPSLEHVDHGPQSVVSAMAGPIWREVESRADWGPRQLGTLMSIARRGLDIEGLQRAYGLAIERFSSSNDPETAATYLGLAVAIDAQGATQALVDKLATLDEAGKTALVLPTLPEIFGSRFSFTPAPNVDLDIPTLLRLVILAYRTVRPENDNDRTNTGAYSPDRRDNAEDARSSAFKRLVETPGRETFDALQALLTESGFPVPATRLEALARERAALDSEMTAWVDDDAPRFERRWEKEPATGPELQALAIARLEDIQHDLLHADFAQGPTVSALPDEAAVQSWLADRLRLLQGWSYSVEREPETVDAKKPDIVLTARAARAKVPVEIKVAESWSLAQLETALEEQLCGQYLRARDCRAGLLVFVHQKPRRVGWRLSDGSRLNFAKLVEHLKERARRIRQASHAGPQPEISVIDVSNCTKATQNASASKKAAKKTTKRTKDTKGQGAAAKQGAGRRRAAK